MRIRTFSPYFKPTGFSRWLFSFHLKVKTTGFSRLALAAIMRFLNGGEHGLQARKPYGFSN